ncbi:hypothetical protein ZIOFF_048106 [Zingiber officinale]|uniref:Leucine-rich repeat-containing N-terminal plant-type domain-containing protein n=1 Tax=Zingiber officinale TaxID=94328 RepID=A0A8J5KXD3_ZINOF|nr:hypothetical protein ZIOFF_048106 [Zingiber officinale]
MGGLDPIKSTWVELISIRSSSSNTYTRLLGSGTGRPAPQIDCCKWSGVVCKTINNATLFGGYHVVELNLQNPNETFHTALRGEILSPSLLNLTRLERLNLSWNDFEGAQIPQFIGSFLNLKYLELSWSNFTGVIPSQLGNLSSLCHLGLQSRWVATQIAHRLDWLSGLSSLREPTQQQNHNPPNKFCPKSVNTEKPATQNCITILRTRAQIINLPELPCNPRPSPVKNPKSNLNHLLQFYTGIQNHYKARTTSNPNPNRNANKIRAWLEETRINGLAARVREKKERGRMLARGEENASCGVLVQGSKTKIASCCDARA